MNQRTEYAPAVYFVTPLRDVKCNLPAYVWLGEAIQYQEGNWSYEPVR